MILRFENNRLLIDLCGAHDAHLIKIEAALEVQLSRRGNVIEIWGEESAQARAAGMLETLYQRLETGKPVLVEDIERELHLRHSIPPVQDTQMELDVGTRIEIPTRKKLVEPRTKAQIAYVQALFEHEMVFGIGPAGTGKTYLAVAAGVAHFLQGHVDRIILCRPAVEAGERLGFLPGTQEEKVDPYMQPLYDALNDFLPAKQLTKYKEEKTIEIAPLAFMRGRTLSRAFVVLDEAQNTTPMQMKMFLTRLGKGSRMVLTGDRTQVDLPRAVPSGLAEAQRLLKDVPGISFNSFDARDVVRHPLVAAIITAYEADALAADSYDAPGR